MKKYLGVGLVFLLFASCSKDKGGVYVRIHNTTSASLTNITMDNTYFGKLGGSGYTAYQSFAKVSVIPFVTFKADTSSQTINHAWYCDPGACNPAYLSDGKYTLEITIQTVESVKYYDYMVNKEE